MNAPHVEEMIAAYLLGALEPREAALVATHVTNCAECVTQLEAAREAIAVMPDALDPMEPRPSLKAQIMAAARREDSEARVPQVFPTQATPPRRRERPYLLALAAGVCAAIAAAAIVWALVLQGQLSEQDDQLADARVAAAAFARSMQTLHMEGNFGGNAVDAAIAVPREGTEITVVVTGLSPLPEGEAYRLWLFTDGVPQADVALTADRDGNVIAQLDVDLSQFDEMELDAQPADATAPGGELVIGGPLR